MNDATCSVKDCGSAVYVKKRQLCRRHYNRLHYSGAVDLPTYHETCVSCGAPTPAAKPNGPRAKYCTDKCRRLTYERERIADGRYAAELEARRVATAARDLPVHTCVECGGNWSSTHRKSKYCSSRCLNRHIDRTNPLRCTEPDCVRGVRAKGMCAMHWRRRARSEGREANPVWTESRKANYHKRRAQKITTQVEDLRPIDIYERDIWLCGLCSTPVDPGCAWPDPMSPSLDHVQPLSLGGTHTYENVQLAHLTCNVSKGNRVAA